MIVRNIYIDFFIAKPLISDFKKKFFTKCLSVFPYEETKLFDQFRPELVGWYLIMTVLRFIMFLHY